MNGTVALAALTLVLILGLSRDQGAAKGEDGVEDSKDESDKGLPWTPYRERAAFNDLPCSM